MENQEDVKETMVKANDSIDEFAMFKKTDHTKGLTEDLRIEETVSRTWSGVNGCGDESEKQRQVKAAYEGWVAQKLFEYRHLTYITYGHGDGVIKTSSSRAPWPDNTRSCRGSLSLPCYIVFAQG